MQSLTRCLRTRPTTSSHLHNPIANNQPLRFASSSSSSSPFTPSKPTRPNTNNPRQPDETPSIDQILNELNLSNRPQQQQQQSTDPFSVSRGAGQATAVDRQSHSRKVHLKLGPTLGRAIHVEPERGTDLAAALRLLGATCRDNQVRQQLIQQKFHVRRGQMKKNLRIARWRKLFKYSFNHTVSRIQRMRAQGW